MSAALARQGVHVEIATTDADGAALRLDSAITAACPVPVRVFPRDFSERWKFSRGLGRWLWRHACEYDLLHVHALWNFATSAACAAARHCGVPIVLRPCGMLSPYTWGRSPWRKRLYWWAVERRNLASACKVHVTSTAEADEVAALQLRPSPDTVIVPEGVDDSAWQIRQRPDYLRQRCRGRAGDRPTVLFLSRLHPKKGIVDFLLPAFARLRRDAFLVVAGGADEHAPEHEAEVRAAVERFGVADRVALVGSVSPAERWWLFDGADVFVLPSRSENFGIVVAEAMARSVPVVVSNEVQASEHVKRADAGRVVSLSLDELARTVDDLLAEPSARRVLGHNGAEYARAYLNWDRIAASIVEVYEAVASSPTARRVAVGARCEHRG
jgi:glycosyltransferase involved in cell wall biosynthesis